MLAEPDNYIMRSQDLEEFDNLFNEESQRVFSKSLEKGYLVKNAQWWSLTDAEQQESHAVTRSRHKKRREFLHQVKRDLGVAAFYLCMFAFSPTSLARMRYKEFESKYRRWSTKSRDLSAFQQQAEQHFDFAMADSSRKRSVPDSPEWGSELQASDNEPSPKRVRLTPRSPLLEEPANPTDKFNTTDQSAGCRDEDNTGLSGWHVNGGEDGIDEAEGDGKVEGNGEFDTQDQDEDEDEDEPTDEDDIALAQNPHGTIAPFADGRRHEPISELEATIAHLQPTIAHLDERTRGGGAGSIEYNQVVYILETMDIVRMAHEWGGVGLVRLTVPKDVQVAPFVTFTCSRKVVHQAMKHRQPEP
ncbi:hypothetical protein CcaCcLH18_14239 [Colletotrichum camelliae]|nr:hypothetical protein CcaCcLH18_14239 [Colletotrichum camelliae]